jgi:hypothetical protein
MVTAETAKKNPIIQISCIPRCLTIPFIPDKWSSTLCDVSFPNLALAVRWKFREEMID